jgi:hypothetical protein
MSAPKKGTRTSIGPMILLAAVMVVAGVVGISGIYPQIIDAEWVQDTGTHPPKMSLSSPHATRRCRPEKSLALHPTAAAGARRQGPRLAALHYIFWSRVREGSVASI